MSKQKVSKFLNSMDGETINECQWKNVINLIRYSGFQYSRFGNCAMVYNDTDEYKFVIDNSAIAA